MVSYDCFLYLEIMSQLTFSFYLRVACISDDILETDTFIFTCGASARDHVLELYAASFIVYYPR